MSFGLNQLTTKTVKLGLMIITIVFHFFIISFSDRTHTGVFLPFKKQVVRVKIRLLLIIRQLVRLCLLFITELLLIN